MLDKLLSRRLNLELELKDVDRRIKEEQSKTFAVCACGSSHQVKDLEYIQTHWYEEPYGCMGGDQWHENQSVCICPACNKLSKLSEDLNKLKSLFKSIRKTYTRKEEPVLLQMTALR